MRFLQRTVATPSRESGSSEAWLEDRAPICTQAMLTKKYLGIVAYYEECLKYFGDSHLGVDWASVEAAETRYRVMLDLIRSPPGQAVSLLDLGCGASHLLDFIARQQITGIDYTGLDLSPAFVALSRQKHPEVVYYCVDLLESSSTLPR